MLGKQWVNERKAYYEEEKDILKIFLHDTWYRLKVKPQQVTPMVQSVLEESKQVDAHLSLGEKLELLQILLLKNQTFSQAMEEEKFQDESILEIPNYIYKDPFLNL